MTPYRAPAREPHVPKSAVTRAPTETRSLIVVAGILALSCAVLAVAAVLGWTHDAFLPGMGALLCGCGAAGVFFGKVLGGSGSAPCPVCGAPIVDIERRARVQGILCAGCNRFLKSKSGVIRPMARQTVAADPLFGAALPMSLAWPPGCVVCGAEATRSLPVHFMKTDSDSLAAGALGLAVVATTGVRSLLPEKSRVALDAPHCADHDDGVIVTEGGPSDLFLLFRSYPYQRAFCALNATQAVESPATGRDVEYPEDVLASDPADVVAGREGVRARESD
ncbi:MAG: hypothetical protein ABJE95_22605 [Byssovorax sp.]